ncbi:MAG: hypothetical protein HYV63_29260 [Candidatus Schekmanbacteria bacterium]|nr:hypothetical protein [Candidatus Schekmanbacteria bacterium]
MSGFTEKTALSIVPATSKPLLASASLSQRPLPFPERSRRERRLAETMDEAEKTMGALLQFFYQNEH